MLTLDLICKVTNVSSQEVRKVLKMYNLHCQFLSMVINHIIEFSNAKDRQSHIEFSKMSNK